ncbi:uncharacterized protein [Montipora capricornis]
MFFDLRAGLKNLFQDKQNFGVNIPELPVTRFAGGMLFGAFSKKQCKNVEDFCQRVIQLSPIVAQSEIVLAFFSQWATDGISRNDNDKGKVMSPSRNDEQIVERYQSVAAFSGSGRGEMTLRDNEVVTVIEKNNTGWWLVVNSRGEHGFAPATFLEPLDAVHGQEEEEWREVDDDDRYWIAIASYTAKSDDELTYRAGEEVEVLATSNFGWWKIRLKGEVGLTPGSNLTPKPRHDNMDPFLTEEQRKRVNGSITYNTMQQFLHSTMQQDNWLQLFLEEQHPAVHSTEPYPKSDQNHLQNGTQPHDQYPAMSSTYSSIYASIRAPPPRRDSSKTMKTANGNQDVPKAKELRSQSTPHALEYAAVDLTPSHARRNPEINTENRRESIPQYASVIPKHLRVKARTRSLSEDIAEEITLPARNGSPELPPPPPPSVLLSAFEEDDDPSYTSVKQYKAAANITASPGVKVVRTPDGEIVNYGSRKYQNFLRVETQANAPGEHFVAMTNYSPTADRYEDLPLSAGETVQLLSEDGPWAFVCTVDPARKRGWVPSSILKKKGFQQPSYARRSLSVGDIYNSYLEEEAVSQPKKLPFSSQLPKRPVPTPRSDLDKTSQDVMGVPTEVAPPLPGAYKKNRKPGKVNAHYFAREDFTTNNSKCICIRKGEVGQLLEIQSSGWWKMNVEGVVGWTPGDFWDILQDDDDVDDFANDKKDRSRNSSFGDELWYYGKMSRQKCEELMMRGAKELDYLIRESTQRFASFVLSVKYAGRIRHFPIELTPSGRYVIGKHAFDGLTEIVTFYKQNALFYTQNKNPITLGDSFRGM